MTDAMSNTIALFDGAYKFTLYKKPGEDFIEVTITTPSDRVQVEIIGDDVETLREFLQDRWR